MPSREDLHSLVDSLPEAAIEAAHRSLLHLQIWPPTPQPGVEEWRQRSREWRQERQSRAMQQQHRPGTISACVGGGGYNPDTGAASYGFSHWDGDTFVHETLRRHKGQEFTVIEQVRLDGARLIYKHEITGPGGKRDEREIIFHI